MKNNNDSGRLLVLDEKHGKMLSMSTDGSDITTIVENCGSPDGIAIDPVRRHIYWTDMGVQLKDTGHFYENDGSIERIDFDGANRTVIVPAGGTFTPKQLALDIDKRRIYWCDREGMRVMRAEIDGSNITTLVETGRGETDRLDETRHCVGITLDIINQQVYWTQKGPKRAGRGRMFRAPMELPQGQDPANRKDIELLWDHLPEPIDLELDHRNGHLYWTDRGAPPNGNTLNRALIWNNKVMPKPEIINDGYKEAIGLALDLENERAFSVDLGGNVYCCSLDGSDRRLLYSGDVMFTGIAYLNDGALKKT
jgi:hypothetical protein